jgi:hypothetical protein
MRRNTLNYAVKVARNAGKPEGRYLKSQPMLLKIGGKPLKEQNNG